MPKRSFDETEKNGYREVLEKRSNRKKRRRNERPKSEAEKLPPEIAKKLQKQLDLYLRGNPGDNEKGIEILKDILATSENPKVLLPWQRLASIFEDEVRAGKTSQIENFLNAKFMIAKLSTKVELWAELADDARRYGDLEKALRCYDAMIRSRPKKFKALWDRARLYNQLKNTPKAIEDYTNLLMKFPNVTKAVSELFKIYMAEKNKVLAQKLLINHLQRTRSNPWGRDTTHFHSPKKSMHLLQDLADLLLKEKDWKEVIEQIREHQKFLQKNGVGLPPNLKCFIAIANLNLGCKNVAVETLKEFDSYPVSRTPIMLFIRVCQAFVDTGDADQALKRLKKLQDGWKSLPKKAMLGVCELFGDAYRLKNEFDETVSYYRQCLAKLQGKTAFAESERAKMIYLKLGDVYMKNNQHQKAMETFQNVMKARGGEVVGSSKQLEFLRMKLLILAERCNVYFENDEHSIFLSYAESIISETLSFIKCESDLKDIQHLPSAPEVEPEDMLEFESWTDICKENQILRLLIQLAQVWEARGEHADSLKLVNLCEKGLSKKGRRGSAEERLETDKEYRQLWAELHFVKCGNCIVLKNLEDAYQSWRVVSQYHGDSIPVLRTFQALLIERNYAQKLTRFLERRSGTQVSLLNAHLSFAKDNYTVVKDYQMLLKKDPKDPYLHFLIGLCHLHTAQKRVTENREEHLNQAFNFFFQYQKLDGYSAESYYNVGRAYHFLNKNQQARTYYDKCLLEIQRANLPDSQSLRSEAAYNLSLIYKKMGQPQLEREVIMKNIII